MKLLVATPRNVFRQLLAQEDISRMDTLVEVHHAPDIPDESAYLDRLAETQPNILMTGWGSPLLTAKIFDAVPTLKYMVHITGELRHIVERECLVKGLTVSNWGDVPAASVAEAALMMILAGLRRVRFWQRAMHEEKQLWHHNVPETFQPEGLFDKQIGLYGFGKIARNLVPMLKPFGVKTLTYSPYDSDDVLAEFGVSRASQLDELFEWSDIVSIHAPSTEETFHSVNTSRLSKLKDGALLVNTARGAIIDTTALVAELQTGRIHAALDVYEEEPLAQDSPLRGLANCLLFPHQAGPTPDFQYRCGKNAVDQVIRFVRGEPLKYVITPEIYDRIT